MQIKYNYSKRTNKIKYIVIHDTGNTVTGSDAQSHFNYFNTGNRSSSADFFVDDTQALQVNDYIKYYTWHCGDGNGRYGITNNNSIGIEICVNRDGNYTKAFNNTVALTKRLMKELNIPIENVVRHYDASHKKCPASMSANNWELWKKFKELIALKEITSVNDIVWELAQRGIISDKALWLKKLEDDKNAYWLARKSIEYLRKAGA